MEWFKKHTDAVIVLTGILGSVLWMNTQFSKINEKFGSLEKDIAVLKAVLICKDVMPKELAVKKGE